MSYTKKSSKHFHSNLTCFLKKKNNRLESRESRGYATCQALSIDIPEYLAWMLLNNAKRWLNKQMFQHLHINLTYFQKKIPRDWRVHNKSGASNPHTAICITDVVKQDVEMVEQKDPSVSPQ
ncbi:hypothetical protein CDAR_51821 [Caerostris darwini]|uniref:Uncharacterized protein n=1 Tax=Caerostris darwini TaxID=1538125 RepID=A0AAV4V6H6_9ARAC|nr:hypothetical protein CDAR_51821 [Caerostris darwini]